MTRSVPEVRGRFQSRLRSLYYLWLHRAKPLLKALNALDASTQRIPSISPESYNSLTQWTMASHDDFWPAHNCWHPVISITSCLITVIAAFPIKLWHTSPTPHSFYTVSLQYSQSTHTGLQTLYQKMNTFSSNSTHPNPMGLQHHPSPKSFF